MLRHVFAIGSVVVVLTTGWTWSAPSIEATQKLENPCVSPFTNIKIGQTKIGSDVCTDGTVAPPNDTLIIGKTTVESANDGSVAPAALSNTVCNWRKLGADRIAGTRWGANPPPEGEIQGLYCYPRVLDTSRDTGGGGGLVDTRFVPNAGAAVPVAPPPPDPAVLAEQAYGELQVPTPAIGAGPDRTKLAVSLWTWLWIDNPGPLTNTVAAGGISVTVTATLSSVDWSLGEPATKGDTYVSGPTATLTCQGTGTPPPPGYDWKAEPPCGYIFHWRSLKERTGGSGKWPIKATSTWAVTWQANTGATGATTLSATGNDQFDVEEYRIVLVEGPGG